MDSKKAKGTGKRVKDHGVKVGANEVTTGRGDMENEAVKIRSESK